MTTLAFGFMDVEIFLCLMFDFRCQLVGFLVYFRSLEFKLVLFFLNDVYIGQC